MSIHTLLKLIGIGFKAPHLLNLHRLQSPISHDTSHSVMKIAQPGRVALPVGSMSSYANDVMSRVITATFHMAEANMTVPKS